MTPTPLNLFFVSEMLKPCDPRGWKKFLARTAGRTWNAANSEKVTAGKRGYYQKNRDAILEKHKQQYAENPAVKRGHYWKNRDEIRERKRQQRITRREECLARERLYNKTAGRREYSRNYARAYCRKKKVESPAYRLLQNMRNRLRLAVKNNLKAAKTCELLGMPIAEFRIYLQGQFRPGMDWANYGSVWSVDHIRPCAKFDMSDPAQQRECFHWSNCQPLFTQENLRKGDRV